MQWMLLNEKWGGDFASWGVETVDAIERKIPEEYPTGSYTLALTQFRPAENWVDGPYEVTLSTLFAGYMVCTHIPNSIHQYRGEEWSDARERFIYQCKKRMEETELLRCSNCGKSTDFLVRDNGLLYCPMCFNGTETIGQLFDKELEKSE